VRIRFNILFALLILVLFGNGLPIQNARADSPVWLPIAPGIEFRQFFLAHPNRVYVARMNREQPELTLETGVAQGRLSGGVETVRTMASQLDGAINYWGEEWGNRNQVVVAINGYFYDTETGVPWSGQVQSGWYLKRFEDRQSGSGFAWTLDEIAFIGGCVRHQAGKQFITHLPTNKTQTFDGINIPRDEDQLILYTAQYDTTTLTDDDGIELLVELEQPLLILPTPAMVVGTVREVRDGLGSTAIPFDHVVLSASGSASEGLRTEVNVGDQIGISQEIRHLMPNCQTPSSLSWSKTYAAVGASFTFLEAGVIKASDNLGAVLRNPRTAVAYNDQYIFFIVVDGRDRMGSVGMSIVDLGVFAKNILGATWGAALDGGGSSTMVINDEVVNHPNLETVYGNSRPIPADLDQVQIEERAVANSLMMVAVQPKQASSQFSAGQQVIASTTGDIQVRSGPGTNYALVTTLSPGSEGIILPHSAGLNGVLAQDVYWWLVDFGDVRGWVVEDILLKKTP
jgi:hypothetical protein